MKKPNPKDQKYFAGHIFLDQSFLNDTDTYVSLIEQGKKDLIEENNRLKAQLNDDGEIPPVDIPVKKTRYKLTEIKKK